MLLEKSEVNGFTVEIHADEPPFSPRDDWDHGCELVLSHRRYDLPNDGKIDFGSFGGWGEIAQYLKDELGALVVLPVYMLDHSGIALSLGDFADPWDSGQAGLAYVTPKNWADTQGTEWTGSEADIEQARLLCAGDVQTYGQYLNGEVYGYVIKDFDGETLDECWGMYGYEYVTEEASGVAENMERQIKCTGELDRHAGQITHSRPCPFHETTKQEGAAS